MSNEGNPPNLGFMRVALMCQGSDGEWRPFPLTPDLLAKISAAVTAMPSLVVSSIASITAMPVTPPAHVFAINNEDLKFKLSGASSAFKIVASFVNLASGVQSGGCTRKTANGITDVILCAAQASGTTYVTMIMATNLSGGALDFILTISSDVVLTIYQVAANKSVLITPSGISTF